MRQILIADRDPGIRSLLRRIVRVAVQDAQVETAEDGVETLEKLGTCSFDLAIIDSRMPRMSGTGIVRAARRRGVDTDIVLLSEKATAEEAKAAARTGAQDFLEKPVMMHRLLNTVRGLLEGAGAGTEACAGDPVEKRGS